MLNSKTVEYMLGFWIDIDSCIKFPFYPKFLMNGLSIKSMKKVENLGKSMDH